VHCKYVWWLLLFLLPCVNTTCFGQTVKIRLINVTTGSPLPKQQVSVAGFDGKDHPDKPDLRLVTDANGEVQFELPRPIPAHFAVRADLSDSHWYCDCAAFVTTAEVMQTGFMTRPPDEAVAHTQTSWQLKPGDILFRARPTPWWVRVLYPLVKN
jgi:hypothetical protein